MFQGDLEQVTLEPNGRGPAEVSRDKRRRVGAEKGKVEKEKGRGLPGVREE